MHYVYFSSLKALNFWQSNILIEFKSFWIYMWYNDVVIYAVYIMHIFTHIVVQLFNNS